MSVSKLGSLLVLGALLLPMAASAEDAPAKSHWWQKGQVGAGKGTKTAPVEQPADPTETDPDAAVNSAKSAAKRRAEKNRKLREKEAKADPRTTRMWYYDPFDSMRKCLTWDEARQARLSASNAIRPCYNEKTNGLFERDRPKDE